jgi:hypothetical protein
MLKETMMNSLERYKTENLNKEVEYIYVYCGSKQPNQKVHDTPTSTNTKLCVVVCTCHPSYMRSVNRIMVQASQGINVKPYLENA